MIIVAVAIILVGMLFRPSTIKELVENLVINLVSYLHHCVETLYNYIIRNMYKI